MPKINQALLDRLAAKLGVKKAQVYSRIQYVQRQTFLDRHLAALKLASDEGINIHKYSTPEERSQLRRIDSPNMGPFLKSPAAGTEKTPLRVMRVTPNRRSSKIKKYKDNTVFVVHGRNEPLRKSLFEFLRALGLHPREWAHALMMAKGANPWTLDVVYAAMAKVQAVVVLFSADDEVRLKDEFCAKHEKLTEGRLRGQPRPNVIFEAGLALGSHPEKTLLIQVGELRGFTDILGKHIPKLTNETTVRNDFANRLEKIGCKVDKTGSDWQNTGNFSV